MDQDKVKEIKERMGEADNSYGDPERQDQLLERLKQDSADFPDEYALAYAEMIF